MPAACASAAALSGPTCSTSCAYTVLMECTVPSMRSTGPKASLPKFETVHGPDGVGSVICAGAGKTCLTVSPCSAFAARTNGLNVEPACRPRAATLLAAREVDLERVVVPAADVGADRAALVERDHCGLRIVRLVQHLRDRGLRRLLIVEVRASW